MSKIESAWVPPIDRPMRKLFVVEERSAADHGRPASTWHPVASYDTLAEAEAHPPVDWTDRRITVDPDLAEDLREYSTGRDVDYAVQSKALDSLQTDAQLLTDWIDISFGRGTTRRILLWLRRLTKKTTD